MIIYIPKDLVIVSHNGPENVVDENVTAPTDTLEYIKDGKIGTTIGKAESLTIRIKAELCDRVTLQGLVGTELVLKQYQGETLISEQIISLSYAEYIDIWGYFYDPFNFADTKTPNLLSLHTGELEITVNNPGGVAEIGLIAPGVGQFIGKTKAEQNLRIKDYSIKDTDEFGNTFLLARDFAKRGDFVFYVPTYAVSRIFSILSKLRGKACLCIASNIDASAIYGFIEDFEVLYKARNDEIACNLTIQGLI